MKFDEIRFEEIENMLEVRAGMIPDEVQADGGCSTGCVSGGTCVTGCEGTGVCWTGCGSWGRCVGGCGD